jgi:hypothetical protein
VAALAVPSPVEDDHVIGLAARAKLVRQILEPLTGVPERDDKRASSRRSASTRASRSWPAEPCSWDIEAAG